MSQKMTKQVNLTQDFIRRAAADPSSALAAMFMAAFGVDLLVVISVVIRAIEQTDTAFVIFCLTAGVQLRGNVTWVGRDFDNVRTKYPEFVIEGRAGVSDVFNFGAAHAAGHVLAHFASHAFGTKVLQKAGSCITGEFATTSEAGLINKEISDGWSQAARMEFAAKLPSYRAAHGSFVDKTLTVMITKATTFNTPAPKPTTTTKESAKESPKESGTPPLSSA